MWLLSTSRAELHYFPDYGSIPGGYAILSHTWSLDGEQTFQDVKAIMTSCKKTGANPRDHVSEKIRKCCEIAERDGYAWVWIDSCCIDRGSSTALSEAINSMFTWYALSEVCYAFLEDVHQQDSPYPKGSEFRRARWHTRGWTLQELLAPAFVVFLSMEWEPIGTKSTLDLIISDFTGIHHNYLNRRWNILHASIAERMAWAAERHTTRVEDEAYCLLGLFSIHMPTLYGEGRQAFQRLQAELVKSYPDTSLFAWGDWHGLGDATCPQLSLATIHAGFYAPSDTQRFLFATSPRQFSRSRGVRYTPSLPIGSFHQPYMPSQWTQEVCAHHPDDHTAEYNANDMALS